MFAALFSDAPVGCWVTCRRLVCTRPCVSAVRNLTPSVNVLLLNRYASTAARIMTPCHRIALGGKKKLSVHRYPAQHNGSSGEARVALKLRFKSSSLALLLLRHQVRPDPFQMN